MALCILAGFVLGLGLYTFHYAEGGSYFSDNPIACANCHIMREHLDSWARSSHHAVATCNDCHTPHALVPKYLSKAENGFWHSTAFTLQTFKDPLVIRPHNRQILEANCVYCHGNLVADVVGHHRLDGTGVQDCTRCHGAVGHGPPR